MAWEQFQELYDSFIQTTSLLLYEAGYKVNYNIIRNTLSTQLLAKMC